MKKPWIITMGILALVTVGVASLSFSRDRARTSLEETRRALRQQGFKIDLAEFDLSASAELRARAAALTNTDLAGATFRGADPARRARLMQERLDFMPTIGSNAAVVVWQQAKLPAGSRPYPWPEQNQFADDLWPAWREIFSDDRAALDAACAAAMAGPIQFDLVASRGLGMLLRHLQALRGLSQMLGTGAMLELHDGNKDAAWTNLLAVTRLVSAWDPEPAEVSHLVRFGCTTLAYHVAWQALQADGWGDDRLARLQREWESVDFFRGLPEISAFARAGAADLCQRDRQAPLDPSFVLRQLFQSPRDAWYGFVWHWRQIRYRHHGTYEDESALLLYYRDRELEVRQAVQAPTWAEMRLLPGVTNTVPLQSKHPSPVHATLNLRQYSLSFMRGSQGLLGRAAEAEATRRLLITAIALERYRGRHGGYPKTLEELVPELLQGPPVDFMDGKPLRYRLGEDGHFVLYSVGLVCVDDGGNLPRRKQRNPYGPSNYNTQQASDLIWLRPASATEIKAQQAEDEKQVAQERAAIDRRWGLYRRTQAPAASQNVKGDHD